MNAVIQSILVLAAVAAALSFLLFRVRSALLAGSRRPYKPGTTGFASRWKGDPAPAEKPRPPRSTIAGLQDFEDPPEAEGACTPSKCAGCRGCG